jgi:hypothetical protein
MRQEIVKPPFYQYLDEWKRWVANGCTTSHSGFNALECTTYLAKFPLVHILALPILQD